MHEVGLCSVFMGAQAGEKIWWPVCVDSLIYSVAFPAKGSTLTAGSHHGTVLLFAPTP